MEEKKCPMCELLPEFPEKPVMVYLYTEVDFLMLKLLEKFEKNGLNFKTEDSMVILPNQDFRQFLLFLQKLEFSQPEQEGIKLCYLEREESILSILPRFKSLSSWLSKIIHEDYLKILRDNRLTIHFHPLVNFAEKVVFGFECLVRGVRKNGDLVYPKYLFESAIQTGTLFYLDRSCREMAIKTAAVKGLKNFKVFVNFLPTAIYDPNFCLKNTIKWAYNLEWDPKNLVFEVVESEKVQDLNHLKNILDFYRKEGFLVALDDIGTGYSSLDALIKLRPDFIKLSRELIEGINDDAFKHDLVSAIVESVKKSEIRVIAEGIEKMEEASIVFKLGVELMQGYLFAKPNPEPILEVNF